jgi:hypothetical protein
MPGLSSVGFQLFTGIELENDDARTPVDTRGPAVLFVVVHHTKAGRLNLKRDIGGPDLIRLFSNRARTRSSTG